MTSLQYSLVQTSLRVLGIKNQLLVAYTAIDTADESAPVLF